MKQFFMGVALLSIALVSPPALSQGGRRAGVKPKAIDGAILINPLGFLQFGPNFEWEPSLSDFASIAVGVRIPTLGLMTQLVAVDPGDVMESGWTASAAGHFYPSSTRQRGFYVGPRVEAGAYNTSFSTGTVWAVAADGGYRWVFGGAFMLGAGAQLGAYFDNWKNKPAKGTAKGGGAHAFGMLVLSVGYAY